jgi:flagellar basal-body rod protein FlgB
MSLQTTDQITSLLTSFLNTQSRRAQIVSSNIANADTPGYLAKQLDFADHLLSAARQAVAPQSLELLDTLIPEKLKVSTQIGNNIGLDGNSVDIAREMVNLNDAGLQYLTGVQLLQSRLRTLRTAIREGRQ